MKERRASRTAVLVCQGRAAADGLLAPDRFHDPTAIVLLREDERVPVRQVREGVPPQKWGERMAFEMVRGCAEVMVTRTVAIDEAVRSRSAKQLVVLGAGLDDRAWRMPELAGVDVFEVDHPASQQDKRDRLGELARHSQSHSQSHSRSRRFVPVDFSRDRLEVALAAAGHSDTVATTWIWEGVVPYLTRAQVAATVAAVESRSAAGSRLVVNYQSPALATTVGWMVARTMNLLARQPDVLAGEPRRSAWTAAAMRELLAEHGFTVASDEDLLAVAARLSVSVTHPRSLRNGRVAVADR